MSPLVSVVVPVFNGLPHLREALESVLAQTYRDLELVVADGGSTDGSQTVVEDFAKRDSRVRRVEGASGAAANWTAATTQAQGAYIKLLCQDDLLRPDAVAKQVADLESHPNAVMATARRDVIDARGRIVTRSRGLQGLSPGELPVGVLIRRCFDYGTNVIGEPLAVLFRKTPLLEAMPWVDTEPLMLDVVTYERVAQLRPTSTAVARSQTVGAFRVSSSSWSTQIECEQLAQYRVWQAAFAERHPSITPKERVAADRGAARQARRRRFAYAILRARGGLRTTAAN